MKSDRPSWLPNIDLTGLTRDEDVVVTYIEVLTPQGWFPWLMFGSLSTIDPGKEWCRIAVRMDNITDIEHDSCYAFAFDVTHVALSYVNEGNVVFNACIAGANDDADSFRVPSSGEELFKRVEEAERCPTCEDGDAHLISDYLPQHDPKLWKHLRGRKIRISLCPKRKDED